MPEKYPLAPGQPETAAYITPLQCKDRRQKMETTRRKKNMNKKNHLWQAIRKQLYSFKKSRFTDGEL